MKTPLNAELVIEQMHDIRQRGRVTARQFQSDAARATDWREYVKAHPIAAATGAALLGYAAVPNRGDFRSVQSESAGGRSQKSSQASNAGVGAGLMAFAGSMASTMIKNMIMNQLHELQGRHKS